jgi:poly(3-hydroxybutyrate) depolymerase
MRPAVPLVLATLFAGAAVAADALPPLAADIAAVTVSGVSAGGYMAVQFQVAHSSTVAGVGALAAGPYYCAQGSFWRAYYSCTTPSTMKPLPQPEELKTQSERYARDGLVDSTGHLPGARVWLFSGGEDETVSRPVVEAAEKFYALFKASTQLVRNESAGHGMITESAGNACGASRRPFINQCGYDAAGELLRYVLDARKVAAGKADGRLFAFDQNAFASGSAHAIGMAPSGYAYVPKACETRRCRVHVAFHGCRQSAEAIGERFVREAGYNRWADAHRLIVLYPQAVARYGWGMAGWRWSYIWNPRGCWDWWGYTGARYATREGPQVKAVFAMVQRLGERKK